METAVTEGMTFDERYRAISARDTRFDGQFVLAVRTTGIYCRPSCPARTPKPQNVTFYPTSAAAHEVGYRACKRCLPEAAPGSPLWDVRSDVAARAMRHIADGVVEREGVAGLAARLGYSSRHLARVLGAELGAGPLALARAHRAQTARMLLTGTDLAIADVAFSAGFTSLRQFNDTVRDVFGMTPGQVRRLGRSRASGAEKNTNGGPPLAPGAIDLVLPYRRPFDATGLFAWLAARAIPGIETVGARSYARHLLLDGGPTWFSVVLEEQERLRLSVRLSVLSDLSPLVARVRRLFDLDADPLAIDEALAEHPELRASVTRTPGIRVPGAIDPHEMLIRAMIGQQISVAAARTALSRLAEQLGERTPEGLLFPTMAAIAEQGAAVLRGPQSRMSALIEAATALAAGDITLTSGDDRNEQRHRLLTLRGVGPWTADYVRMRITGDPDVSLAGDVAVRNGAAALGIPNQARPFHEWAKRAAPWRSYLTAHLWRHAPATAPRHNRTPQPTEETS